jgi:hypothetical protein
MSVDGVLMKEFDLTGKDIHPPAPWELPPRGETRNARHRLLHEPDEV